jgi:uncharacterized protein (TIGR02246 family)
MNATTITTDAAARMEKAWNDADGAAFGDGFADDADFVDIRGDHHVGRQAIAAGHQAILETVYAGSTVRYEVTCARSLDDRIVVGHLRSTLVAPTGPLAGENHSTATLVLVRDGDSDDWPIAVFHNTLVTG